MEKISVDIEVSGYTGMTAEKVELALNYYFGEMVNFRVTNIAQPAQPEELCQCTTVILRDGVHCINCGLPYKSGLHR